MVTQQAISFKISLNNLEDIDNLVRDIAFWTNRNKELNKAVSFYIEYQKAKAFYNGGDPARMKAFVERYIHRNPGNLFDR